MRFWTAYACVLLAALVLTAVVAASHVPAFEADLIDAVQDSPLPGHTLANLIYAVTHTEYDAVVGVVLALVLLASGRRRPALLTPALLVVLALTQSELKELVGRERPPFDPDDLWSVPTSASFPSGHTMSATVVYGWLLFCALNEAWPDRWRRFAIGVALAGLVLPPLAAVTLGVHWPSDILGGWLWGLVLLLPAARLARRPDAAARPA